jgi:hypothetical protein
LALPERESNCDEHIEHVRVRWRETKQSKALRIVAGILRVLAEHTDGFCAYQHADDADFISPGMSFWFRTEKLANEFRKRIPTYLTSTHAAKLEIS